ncbi:MAG TPA: hypothetical protein VGC72_14975 [Candidatus Elarobacter sp.]|jgi:hypothetical protein
MPAGFRCIAAIVLTALPLAARADGVNFTVPDHYLVEAARPQPVMPPVYRVWGRPIDGARHSLVASATPASAKLTNLVDAVVAFANMRHAIDVSRTDAPPLCGVPSVRVAYAFPGQLSFVFRYTIVRGRVLVASYARPTGSAADPAALAALDTLCSGVHQPGGPPGWTLETPYPPNGSAWRAAPGSRSLVAQIAVPSQPGRDLVDQPADKQGTVTADRKETCGAITIRRATTNLDDGRIREFASGVLNGYDYVSSYVRPASEPADPGALQTLTSFCADTLAPV